MQLDLQTFIAIAVPTGGALVWLLRLEGRINLNERLHNDLAEDVKYIRDRIDQAINGQPSFKKRASD